MNLNELKNSINQIQPEDDFQDELYQKIINHKPKKLKPVLAVALCAVMLLSVGVAVYAIKFTSNPYNNEFTYVNLNIYDMSRICCQLHFYEDNYFDKYKPEGYAENIGSALARAMEENPYGKFEVFIEASDFIKEFLDSYGGELSENLTDESAIYKARSRIIHDQYEKCNEELVAFLKEKREELIKQNWFKKEWIDQNWIDTYPKDSDNNYQIITIYEKNTFIKKGIVLTKQQILSFADFGYTVGLLGTNKLDTSEKMFEYIYKNMTEPIKFSVFIDLSEKQDKYEVLNALLKKLKIDKTAESCIKENMFLKETLNFELTLTKQQIIKIKRLYPKARFFVADRHYNRFVEKIYDSNYGDGWYKKAIAKIY